MESTNFKTPSYQRKAYKNYLERKKEDQEKYIDFKEKMKINQRKYYLKNREKILAKKAAEREAKRNSSSEDEQ